MKGRTGSSRSNGTTTAWRCIATPAVRVISRGGFDWTERFPSIAAAATWLDASSFIVDGEAVVLDYAGRADFGLLQQALGGRGGKLMPAMGQ